MRSMNILAFENYISFFLFYLSVRRYCDVINRIQHDFLCKAILITTCRRELVRLVLLGFD